MNLGIVDFAARTVCPQLMSNGAWDGLFEHYSLVLTGIGVNDRRCETSTVLPSLLRTSVLVFCSAYPINLVLYGHVVQVFTVQCYTTA